MACHCCNNYFHYCPWCWQLQPKAAPIPVPVVLPVWQYAAPYTPAPPPRRPWLDRLDLTR